MDFYGHTLDELRTWATAIGLPAFRASQLFAGLYHNEVKDFADIKGLPRDLAERLAKDFSLFPAKEHTRQRSRDGTIVIRFACPHKLAARSAARFARRAKTASNAI
jgi:23S rRNA (adenine2503-C2)-methyltransferase